MTTAWGVPWLLEPTINKGGRVLLVTEDTRETIEQVNYEPPSVFGRKATRLGPGVFGYKTGATLLIWPQDRGASSLPNIAKQFHVVLDPVILQGELAAVAMTIRFSARWRSETLGLVVTAAAGIANSGFSVAAFMEVANAAVSDPSAHHLTMPYLCGRAAGSLLNSKVGKWLAIPSPERVVLRDALGRAFTMDDVMPVVELSSMGKKFRLCAEVSHEIRFVETHG